MKRKTKILASLGIAAVAGLSGLLHKTAPRETSVKVVVPEAKEVFADVNHQYKEFEYSFGEQYLDNDNKPDKVKLKRNLANKRVPWLVTIDMTNCQYDGQTVFTFHDQPKDLQKYDINDDGLDDLIFITDRGTFVAQGERHIYDIGREADGEEYISSVMQCSAPAETQYGYGRLVELTE